MAYGPPLLQLLVAAYMLCLPAADTMTSCLARTAADLDCLPPVWLACTCVCMQSTSAELRRPQLWMGPAGALNCS
jgi:hypothetical protein